jgi:hypothetical protein
MIYLIPARVVTYNCHHPVVLVMGGSLRGVALFRCCGSTFPAFEFRLVEGHNQMSERTSREALLPSESCKGYSVPATKLQVPVETEHQRTFGQCDIHPSYYSVFISIASGNALPRVNGSNNCSGRTCAGRTFSYHYRDGTQAVKIQDGQKNRNKPQTTTTTYSTPR